MKAITFYDHSLQSSLTYCLQSVYRTIDNLPVAPQPQIKIRPPVSRVSLISLQRCSSQGNLLFRISTSSISRPLMMETAFCRSFCACSESPIVFGFCCSVSRQPSLKLSAILRKSSAVYPQLAISQRLLNVGQVAHIILFMNQSFDASSNYHLPRLPQNQSAYLRTSRANQEMSRSMSQQQPTKTSKASLTQKIVMLQNIKPIEEYDTMNEKDLLRQHEKLLKILKKFQEIIDINLKKKQKEREKASKPQSSREDIYNGQVVNNKKIIENYQKELRQLQSLKKCRKLHEVIEEKSQVQASINKLKKEIFNLKNQDNLAGRSLVADRGIIEKELKEHEKDLKIQLIKKQQYQKKLDDLNNMLSELKKDCQGINISELSNQKSHNQQLANKLAIKRKELDEVTRAYVNYEESIQENMVAKAKRNKNVTKEIEACDRKIAQVNLRIQKYKEKVTKYQQAMQILPKDLASKQNKVE